MGRKLIDLTGQRFGNLVVLKRYEQNTSSGHPRWVCQCDCGNVCIVTGSSLKSGTKSCGCARKKGSTTINEIGHKYGRLSVLSRVNSKNNKAVWLCQCECGNQCEVKGQDLRKGHVISCGHCQDNFHKKDETGKKYGLLTVLENAGPDTQGNITWKCQCSCGSIVIVSGKSLRAGTTQSCGCLKSKGELLIAQILTEHNIRFEKQKTFNDCRFPNTLGVPRFDFYIPDKRYLIEFDGEQHYGLGTWGQQNYTDLLYRDNYKNEWCILHNMPLIRIPYTQLDKLTLEDLQLETSNFIYRKEEGIFSDKS